MPESRTRKVSADDTKSSKADVQVGAKTDQQHQAPKQQPGLQKSTEEQKSLKRTAPTDGTEQGDSKRVTKKPVVDQQAAEPVSTSAAPNPAETAALAASAAALLSSVPANSDVAQHVLQNSKQLAEVLTAAANNLVNSPIAVASMSQVANSVLAGGTPTIANVEELVNTVAAAAAAQNQQSQQQQQQQQQQPQQHQHQQQQVDDGAAGKRNSSLRNLTNDERRQRRLLRNRVAAKECRRKKKAYVADLEEKVTRMEEENTRLRKEVEELNAKLTLGAMRLDENVRLIKEVEELNAKLAMNASAAHQHQDGKNKKANDTKSSDSKGGVLKAD